MKKFFSLILLFSFGLLLAGCGTTSETCPIDKGFSCGSTSGNLNLSGTIDMVINAIVNQDFVTLSTFVGTQGVRFSPYTSINTGSDIVLSAEEVYNGLTMSSTRNRGVYDGSGEPINLSIKQYREKFVSDADYPNTSEILYNKVAQRGNNLNNIAEAYEGKQRVEFYFSGLNPQYEGMDWKSLTLVFDQVDGQRNIIGIIHNQWTI